MWGEVEHEQIPSQSLPLWNDIWRPTGVICKVPCVLNMTLDSFVNADSQTAINQSLDYPKDAYDSNIMLHSIDLQQYVIEMQQMIESNENSSGNIHDKESLMAPQPPANYWNIADRHAWERPSVCNPDSVKNLIISCLDSKCTFLLERKSVAAVALHVGYETATEWSLNVLSNVLGDFLEKITVVLKQNFERCQQVNYDKQVSLDFVIEKTFHQFGLGSKRDFKDYWSKNRFKHFQLIEDASQLMEECKKTIGGRHESLKEREALLKCVKLNLNDDSNSGKRSVLEKRMSSPWVSSTPVLLGEEDVLISSDINLDNVLPVKTPDIHIATGGSDYTRLTNSSDVEQMSLDFEPPSVSTRKRSRSSSFVVHET